MRRSLAALWYAETQGRLDFPIERAYWTKGEFGRQADRMGYDLDGVSDPYALALDMQMDRLKEQELTVTEDDALPVIGPFSCRPKPGSVPSALPTVTLPLTTKEDAMIQ